MWWRMTKGIFIDLDGTLLNQEKQISEFDKKAIKAVIELGHQVYIVTGKSLENALSWYFELDLKTPMITSMGQMIVNPSDESFEPIVNFSDFAKARIVIERLGKSLDIKNIVVESATGDVFALKTKDSNLLKIIADNKPCSLLTNDSIEQVIGIYLEIDFKPENDLKNILNEFNNEYTNYFELSYWLMQTDYPIVHMKPNHIGKSEAMNLISTKYNLSETISFGNGWNDRNMLKESTIGYAMLNSLDKVKSFASRVTEFDNNNSGVGKELVKIFNLKI